MRMMMRVSIPVEAGNKGVRDGSLPKTVMEFVNQMKPEACYFGPSDGKRAAFFFFDLKDPSMIPSAAEAFFENLNASIELMPVMNLDEMRAGVERAMKRTQ